MRHIVEKKSAGELLSKTHHVRGEHIEAWTAVVDGVILVHPVHLLHNVLRARMPREMHQPVFTLTTAFPANEEWREILSSTSPHHSLIERRLNEAPPVS